MPATDDRQLAVRDARQHGQPVSGGVRLFWGNPVEVDAYLTVKLDPYTEQGGWAPVGKTWLTGTVSVSLGEPELTATIDAARSFRVTGPGGLVLRAPTGRLVIKSNSGLPGVGGSSNDATVFAEVPADLERLTLTFLPEGSFAVAETGVPVRWRALARTATDNMVIRAR